MIGLLALTALPTTIAVAEGISSQKRAAAAAAQPADEKLMRKFHLRCYCGAKGSLRDAVHGGVVVVRDGKVCISPPTPTPRHDHPIEAFYISYPDSPAPLGLVTTVPTTPPTLNWLYVHARTGELRYGNRTQSRAHRVGPWGWVLDEECEGGNGEAFADEDAEGGGGGLTLGGREGFVVVEPEGEEGEGGWEVWWDEEDDLLKGGMGVGVGGRRVLRVSLEREFVEGREVKGGGEREGGKGENGAGKSEGKGEEKKEEGVKKEKNGAEQETTKTEKKKENMKNEGKEEEKKAEKKEDMKEEKREEKKSVKKEEKGPSKGPEKKDAKDGKKQEENRAQKGKKLEHRPKKEVGKKEGPKKEAEAVKTEKPKKGQE